MKNLLRRLLATLLSATLVLAVLSACGQMDPASSGSASGAVEARDNDLVVAMVQDLTTYDPIGSSALQDQIIYRLIYSRLFDTDEDMQPVPELVDHYEEVSDTQYVFTIRQGAKFSDGAEITAEDVAYSLERAHQSEVFANLMATVDTIRATGDYEVTITTTGPSPALYQALAHPGSAILPKTYLEQVESSGDWSQPVTSGRYVLTGREEGVSVTVSKNTDYFDPDTAAQNDSLTFRNVAEDSSRTVLVQTGEADISTAFATPDYETVQRDNKVKLHEKAGTTIQYIGFDVTMAPFDNELVRQAVAYALDREGILTVAANGLGTVSYTVIPPSTLGYVEENPAGYEHNVEKAKELLAQAGYPDGFETTIVVFSDIAETIATTAQSYLRQIGITAKVERRDVGIRMDSFANHQCPVFAAQWGALADAELVLPRLFTQGATYNWSNYQSDEVDALLQSARETSDSDKRVELYSQAVSIIDQAAPWVPIYVPNTYVLANSELKGVSLDGEGLIHLYKLHY